MITVKLTDNSDSVLKRLENAVDRGAWAIGATAEAAAKDVITQEDRVDTGRLRNSVTFATRKDQGQQFSYTDDIGNAYTETFGEAPAAMPDRHDVYIGTNVEYGPYQELGTTKMSGIHFLERGSSDPAKKFKKLMKQSLQNA